VYLKSLEVVGFKSFANKTKLEFEPGMTAIVGPNGCGKSNVSDAVRWVLGEQRARALRGAKMEDVIFNGTDSSKPLGMAEVSMTLADCTASLGVEYDEVCITRRVFRSGESGYFLNRKACRLKDIQRLFMDTGIGTDSYSILEQGKIDQILSSRPDDRRTVFEEASGITKYKADKKEALRKLEHTEANLLRLADVIGEVKRQIISLQRQAGKARRYKDLAEEVRGLDIYVTRERLSEYAQKINEFTGELQVLEQKLKELHEQVEAAEGEAESSRQALTQLEETIFNYVGNKQRRIRVD
jgi:chromosome segregation protein